MHLGDEGSHEGIHLPVYLRQRRGRLTDRARIFLGHSMDDSRQDHPLFVNSIHRLWHTTVSSSFEGPCTRPLNTVQHPSCQLPSQLRRHFLGAMYSSLLHALEERSNTRIDVLVFLLVLLVGQVSSSGGPAVVPDRR